MLKTHRCGEGMTVPGAGIDKGPIMISSPSLGGSIRPRSRIFLIPVAHYVESNREVLRGVGLAIALFASACFLVQSCLLQSFYVPSISMAPTLYVKDCIAVPKFAYGLRLPFFDRQIVSWRTPPRGQVVVFHREDDPRTLKDESVRALVKRVIGVEGDSVSLIDAKVFVNGVLLHEPYARYTQGHGDLPRHFTVPKRSVFLLGDNRDESDDSRFWREPFIPIDRIVGPATAVYWSSASSVRLVY